MRFYWPLWSFTLLIGGSGLSFANLNARVIEFFQCMAAPRTCYYLHIDNYSSYYLLAEFNNPKFQGLLNDFDHLFGIKGKVRLNHIQGLNISTTMTEVKRSAFSSVKSLRNLSLANNFIRRVDPEAFAGLSELRELILSENSIETLPLVVFDKMTKLQTLSLANNKLTSFNFDGFLLNRRLVWLDLSSNQLTTVLVTNSNLKLKTLLLAHNRLTDISDLQRLQQLLSLDVSGNQLNSLGTVNFVALREVDISQNFWDCKYLGQLLQYLQSRNIATPVREPKTEVFNSPNVNRIGCSDASAPVRSSAVKTCGRAAIQITEPMQTTRLPWMVAIYRQQAGSSDFHCAGSLVSNRLVVTAAHCIYLDANNTLSLDETVLFVGRFNILEWVDRETKPQSPLQFIVHPEYVDLSNEADIAMIVMSKPVTYGDTVQPICLPSPSTPTVVPLLLTTYEKDEFYALITGEPRTFQVPAVEARQCQTASERVVCVGGQRWRGPCNVDSGAVLLGQTVDVNDADNGDGRWHLNGVLSTTLDDPSIRYCNLKRFTVFTKVSAFSVWIASYISQFG